MKIKNESYLDLLFNGKNKNYGAYALRSNYTFRMLKSGVIGIFFVSTIFGATLLTGKEVIPESEYVKGDVVIHDVKITPPPPIENLKKPKNKEKSNESTSSKERQVKQYSGAKIKNNDEVKKEDKLAKIEKDEPVIVGVKNKMGDRSEFENMSDKPKGDKESDKGDPDGERLTKKKEDPIPVKKTAPERQVDSKAQYDGDIAAFLSNNLRYPKAAEQQGIEGKVMIEFVVERDGSIGKVKILKNVGGGCSAEAERVVKRMGKWKPGIKNGEPVASYYVLPITFKLH